MGIWEEKKQAHQFRRYFKIHIRICQKAKIKSVKIFASGILVASLSLTSFLSVFAASDRYIMGYLYSGTDHQQIEYVNQTGQTLDTVSPVILTSKKMEA